MQPELVGAIEENAEVAECAEFRGGRQKARKAEGKPPRRRDTENDTEKRPKATRNQESSRSMVFEMSSNKHSTLSVGE